MTSVAVLGPGAVGVVLAAGLMRAGVRVICVARPETVERIASAGMTLRRGSEVGTVHPEVSSKLDEAVDLLLVTVKAPALEDAVERIVAPVAVTVPLLNGIEHLDLLRARLDGDVVAGTIGRIEAYRDETGDVVQPTPGVVITLAEGVPAVTAELVRSAGVDVRVDGTEKEVLWEKLARQAPVAAATALTQRRLGDLRTDADWRPRLERAVRETCAVAAADDVRLRPEDQWTIIDAMPPELTSSTARDVAAARPSELDAITGAAVRAAHRLGVAAPTLEGLFIEAEEACRVSSH